MTLAELINKINEEKPNSFPTSKIIAFVNEVEPEVASQLKIDPAPVYEYDAENLDIDLLAERPYDRLYISYVKSQIDYANEEYASYQLNADQHVQDFHDFVDWVIRTGQTSAPVEKLRFKNTF